MGSASFPTFKYINITETAVKAPIQAIIPQNNLLTFLFAMILVIIYHPIHDTLP